MTNSPEMIEAIKRVAEQLLAEDPKEYKERIKKRRAGEIGKLLLYSGAFDDYEYYCKVNCVSFWEKIKRIFKKGK